MIRNGSKRIISVCDGLGLLQMVSKPDTGRVSVRTLGPQRGGL